MFAICPINLDGADKKIYETSGIPTNITTLGAHFKILINGKNPFDKQNQREKAKKDKEEFHNSIVYFFLAMAMDKDPETLKTYFQKSFMNGNAVVVFYLRSRNTNPLRSSPSSTSLQLPPKSISCKSSALF
jgi:hypothetical protein